MKLVAVQTKIRHADVNPHTQHPVKHPRLGAARTRSHDGQSKTAVLRIGAAFLGRWATREVAAVDLQQVSGTPFFPGVPQAGCFAILNI